jgi:hypothetical protein
MKLTTTTTNRANPGAFSKRSTAKMVEIRQTGKSMEQRIHDKLKPSNHMASATTHTVQGTSAQRVSTTIHHGSTQKFHDEGRSKSLTDMPIQPGAGAPILGQPKKET